MLPVLAIVGRPNVGKSTLFNCLSKSRDALVAEVPGLTRDRIYGQAILNEKPCIIVDTGGLDEHQGEGVQALMMQQALMAVDEADCILWVVDARAGVLPQDRSIADWLRQQKKPVVVVVNKTDGLHAEVVMAEFYELGFEHLVPVATAHQRGILQLSEEVAALLPESEHVDIPMKGIIVAIVGRPNVGKSTLVNRILGEERVIVFDAPGTTRDSIAITFERYDQAYTLIDTAGLRRRKAVTELVEKFSVIKTLQSIEQCQVALMLVDAREDITDQDLTVMRLVLEAGKALVIVVNKWDGLSLDQKESIKQQLNYRLKFASFAPVVFISALHGTGVGELYEHIQTVYRSAIQPLSTGNLTKILARAVATHQPPLVRGRRVKLRYAHCGGHNPPVIVIHGNQTEALPEHYIKFLEHNFREALELTGTPLRVITKTGHNPYAHKRNTLTPRQEYKRKRLMGFSKKMNQR